MKTKPPKRSTVTKEHQRSTRAELSPQRKRTFFIITFLLPFLILGFLEMGLRIGDYDGDLHLVIKRKIGNREFYSINRSVAKRYFAQAGTTIPEPHDETFEIVKKKNTKRIFCIGESTMEGFPYEFHATVPGFLRDRLRSLLPQYDTEVINVGLSAVGSYVVLDFMNELMEYQPDLFIVYVGHNEFYGAYGVGSTVAIAGGPWLTRLTLYFLKFRTFLLLRGSYAKLASLFSGQKKEPVGSMMQQMAATKTIPFGSPVYLQAKEIFDENISRMIAEAKSHSVRILFSTLVSNWKDQPPFVNDSFNADSFYVAGKIFYQQNKFDEARNAFVRAKDLDALRFRMTEEFQELLITLCQRQNVPLARMDSAFLAHSPHGITGNELFLEHLHPNVEGYFLMARTFAFAIRSNSLVFLQTDWKPESSVSDSTLMEVSTVGEFDRTVGKLKTEFLKRRWPFNKGTTNYEFNAANPIESLVFKYLQKEIAWSDARYKLAEYYANNKRFDLARKECLAVSKVIPLSYNPLLRVADYYRMEGKREESKKAYEHCIAVEDNPYAHIKLGLTFLEEERAADATRELETAFRVNAEFGEKLSIEGSSAARYLLAVAYAKMGKIPAAKVQLQLSLSINPNNADAKDLMQQINKLRP